MLEHKPVVIFDFDGTIVDSIPTALTAYNQLAEEFRLKSIDHEQFVALRGKSLPAILSELEIPWLKIPQLLLRGRELMAKEIDNMSPCDGMAELVEQMREREYVVAILTSNATENVERFFARNGISKPTFIDTVSRLQRKSDFLKKRQKQYKGNRLIYVGDEVRDIEAARKAGIHSIAVEWGFNTRESLLAATPTELVTDSQQLLAAVDRIAVA
jgi:phosphoglycolate phosphatase